MKVSITLLRSILACLFVLFQALTVPTASADIPGLSMPTAPKPTERKWATLETDGVHDPRGPGVKVKQQPAEALSKLPPDPGVGNQVRWVKAIEEGYINPRTNIFSGTKVNTLDLDIILNKQGSMPMVRFPHKQHTLWLDCANCHEHLFKYKAGETKISMLSILEGEQCGLCHGAVAFPLTECARCHSMPREKNPQPGGAPAGAAAKAPAAAPAPAGAPPPVPDAAGAKAPAGAPAAATPSAPAKK